MSTVNSTPDTRTAPTRSLKKAQSSKDLLQKFSSGQRKAPPMPDVAFRSAPDMSTSSITSGITPVLRQRKSMTTLRGPTSIKSDVPSFSFADLEKSRLQNTFRDKERANDTSRLGYSSKPWNDTVTSDYSRSTDRSSLSLTQRSFALSDTSRISELAPKSTSEAMRSSRSVTSGSSYTNTGTSLKSSKERSWSNKHLRYRPGVPIIPVCPPFEVIPSIQTTAQQLLKTIRSNDFESSMDHMESPIPRFRYATNLSHHESPGLSTERPDGFLIPESLLSPAERERSSGWLADMMKYGSPEEGSSSQHRHLPDLFSRAHRIASQSNGTIMIVTLYRDPFLNSNSPTHVYVSPGLSVDLASLGTAALQFRERFDYLHAPLMEFLSGNLEQKGLVERGTATRVPQYEEPRVWDEVLAKGDIRGLERDVKYGIDVTVPDLQFQQSSKHLGSGKTISEREIQYLISQVASASQPIEPLAPKCHERFTGYGSIFHTHEPSSVALYNGERHPSQAERRDAGHDMRYVTALTGGLGATFVFELDPVSQSVKSTVHTSWQFSPLQRYGLVKINSLLYKAVQKSLCLPQAIKQGVNAVGWRLPRRSVDEQDGWWSDKSPQLDDLQFVRYQLRIAIPQRVWMGYPQSLIFRVEQDELDEIFRQAPGLQHRGTSFAMATPNKPIVTHHTDRRSPGCTTFSSSPPSPPAPLQMYETPSRNILIYGKKK